MAVNKFFIIIYMILCSAIFFPSEGFSDREKIFDVLNYELNLNIYNCFVKPYSREFTANEIITVKAESRIEQINFDANNASLIIDSVKEAGVSFQHTSDVLTINLDKFYDKDQVFDIEIYYRHKDVNDSAFFVKEGMVFTDCESEGARRWFPCNDVPNDKATLNLIAKVPSNVILGSNGSLVDSTMHGDTIYYNWVSKHPIATYLIAIISYSEYNLDIIYWKKPSNPEDSIQIRFYWQKGEITFNINNIKTKVRKILDVFSSKYGEYPFEKLAFATANIDFPWGGMENQTMIILCPDCWIEKLICHEVIHQWFGDMISPNTWADVWLNEGFATFNEAVWIESQSGFNNYKKDILAEAEKYLATNPGWPIYNSQWNHTAPKDDILFNEAITYSKAGCVLHLLRYVLGDSIFFNSLYLYSMSDRLKYGNISTSEFINFMNENSGRDLNWFFDEWIYQPNHPVYQNNYNYEEIGNGKWKVDYTVYQIQTNASFFKMPIELKITFQNGKDTLIKVNNDYNFQTFSFEFDSEPNKISFDPNKEIVLKEVK